MISLYELAFDLAWTAGAFTVVGMMLQRWLSMRKRKPAIRRTPGAGARVTNSGRKGNGKRNQ
jgi:hypothetical protein